MQQDVAIQARRIIALVFLIIGVILVLLAISAELVGLNFTRGFGVVQTAQFLVGLACVTVAGFMYSYTLRPKPTEDDNRSLQADIGSRLAATGIVFAFVSGFSDLLQIGTHIENCQPPDLITRCGAFIGPLQAGGIIVAMLIIFAGWLLYHTSRGRRDSSSLSRWFQRKTAKEPQQK